MYLIRRVFEVKPGTARRAAEIIAKMGKIYEEAGQRSATRVYTSGSTLPGPANRVYLDWSADVIESPYRDDNAIPEAVRELGAQLREFQEDSHIEFYELVSGE